MSGIIHIHDAALLDEVLERPVAILYKHSPRCWVSIMSGREVDRFHAENPELPLYQIDVIDDRPVSQEAERRLGVPHASPQAILLVDGKPVWSATHGSVRRKTLERSLAEFAGD